MIAKHSPIDTCLFVFTMPRPISLQNRNKIIEHHGSGRSAGEIAQIVGKFTELQVDFLLMFNLTGIDVRTVRKYLGRYRETGDVYVKKSTGRRCKLSPTQVQQLVSVAENNRFATNSALANMIEYGPGISENTVRNYLRKNGLYSRIAAQKPNLR